MGPRGIASLMSTRRGGQAGAAAARTWRTTGSWPEGVAYPADRRRDGVGRLGVREHHDGATEPTAREPRAMNPGDRRRDLDESIERRHARLEIVAERGVARQEGPAGGRQVIGLERSDRRQDALVLGHDMAGAARRPSSSRSRACSSSSGVTSRNARTDGSIAASAAAAASHSSRRCS